MLQRERTRKVRLGIEPEADALLSISGAQAYSIALKRADEVSSEQMAHDCSVVAATAAQIGSQVISARCLAGMKRSS